MDLKTTLIILGSAAAVFAVATWRHRQPYVPGRVWAPPWLAIMSVALLVIILMLAHLVTLWSGTPFGGRAGY